MDISGGHLASSIVVEDGIESSGVAIEEELRRVGVGEICAEFALLLAGGGRGKAAQPGPGLEL